MSFSLDYYCFYPRFLDREASAYSADPDQMSHNTLCNQGLHGFWTLKSLDYFIYSNECVVKMPEVKCYMQNVRGRNARGKNTRGYLVKLP